MGDGVLEFRVLGPVRVARDGTELVVTGTLLRTLLAVLVARAGAPVPVDVLTDVLWPDEPLTTAPQRLQVHVHRLRRLLGESDRILFEQDGYRLRVRQGEVDAERFETLLDAAARASAPDPAGCAELSREALDLWSGAPFGDLDVPVLVDEARRLAERRLAAIELRYEAELRCGRDAEVVTELSGLVREHPLRERLCGLLMTALYRTGRQADALAAFRLTRRNLVDDLGLEPGPALREIEQRILSGEPLELDPPVATRAVPAQLPPQVPEFVGRGFELAELDSALSAGVARVCVLAGTAGVGKTALAIAWAHRVREDFPDGQLYVDLRGYGPDQPLSAADAIAEFLRALGVDGAAIPAELTDRTARFRTLVAGRRVLIVLDNAHAVAQVRPLLPGSPSCFVLITSRDSLAGLSAREGARRVPLDRLPAADAGALLTDLVGDRARAEPAAAAALIEQCARLPLALRVAAELVNLWHDMPIGDLITELAGERDRLDALDVDGDPQTSVRAVLSWSYHRLPNDAARLFRLCGVHPGHDTDAYALAALANTGLPATRRTLDVLLRAHLVEATPNGRIQLHDLLRAYAAELAERTDTETDRASALARLFDFSLHTAVTATNIIARNDLYPRPKPPPVDTPVPTFAGMADSLRWLDAERANLIGIASLAARHGRGEVATDLSVALFRYLDDGYADDAIVLHQHALDAALVRGDRLAQAHATRFIGATSMRMGKLGMALEYGERAYLAYQGMGEQSFQRLQLINLGTAHNDIGNYPQALDCFTEMLAMYEQAAEDGADAGQAIALRNLGRIHGRLGHYDEAHRHLVRALELAVALHDLRREEYIRIELGTVCERRGDYEQAREHLERARAIAGDIGDRIIEGQVYELGGVYWRLGRRDDAFTCVWRCVAAARETGQRTAEASALNMLGTLHRLDGRPAEAVEHHRDALAVAEDTGDRYEQGSAYAGLGDASADLGDVDDAREHWQRALATYRDLGVPEASEVDARLTG